MKAGLFLVAAGIISTGVYFFQLQLVKERKTWPKTDGEVVATKYYSVRTRSGSDNHFVTVKFRYQIADADFEKTETNCFYNKSSAEYNQAKFPDGATVSVYYSRRNPQQSTLNPNRLAQNYDVLGMGLFLLFAGAFVIWWVRGAKKEREAEEQEAVPEKS